MHWNYLAVISMALTLRAGDVERTFRFTRADAGKVPAGWKADQTGTGEGSVWKVVEDSSGPSRSGYVLMQTAESPNAVFNLCVADEPRLKDLEAQVMFKAVRGKLDQGGGIVWRYQDHDNYYIARMNPLEDNYRVYKVVAGKRIQLDTKEGIKVKPGEWHTLKITMQGDRIECFLDGQKQLAARDSTIQTAGRVGLWTKADAQTRFDGFKILGQ